MIKELDVVKVVNSPVNFPHLWNQTGTVVLTYEQHPEHYCIEFTEADELVTLHKDYLQLWTSSVY